MFQFPERQHERLPDGSYRVTVTPPKWSGFGASSLRLEGHQFDRYQHWLHDGGLIQQHLPDLSNEDREVLLSGIGPEEWDREFGDDES
jgi:hypothetical protein